MTNFYLPLRLSIVSTIIVMGVVSIVLIYAGTGIYHDKSIDNHRKDLEVIVNYEINDLIADLEKDGSQLALNAQHNFTFKRAFAARDVVAMAAQLDNEFHQFFVTANLIRLKKLVVFDKNFQYLAEAQGADARTSDVSLECPALIARAQQRKDIDRLRTISQLCVHDDVPFHGLVVPIGGLKLKGYFLLISDPVGKLGTMEKAIGLPVSIFSPDDRLLYRSSHWPVSIDDETKITVTVPLISPQGDHVMQLSLVKDISPLVEDLSSTRQTILLLALSATILSIVLSLLILDRAIFYPLSKLCDAIKEYTESRFNPDDVATEEKSEIHLNIVGAPAIREIYLNLREMAMTDPLTLTHNRHLFSERMKRMFKLSAREDKKAAIILLDMDKFKQVNDKYGHHIGDVLLKGVADRVAGAIRESDEIVRLGGDEFIVLLPLTDAAQARIVALKILHIMEQPFELEDIQLHMMCSLGVSIYPDDSDDEDALMQMADKAMYMAKSSQSKLFFYDELG